MPPICRLGHRHVLTDKLEEDLLLLGGPEKPSGSPSRAVSPSGLDQSRSDIPPLVVETCGCCLIGSPNSVSESDAKTLPLRHGLVRDDTCLKQADWVHSSSSPIKISARPAGSARNGEWPVSKSIAVVPSSTATSRLHTGLTQRSSLPRMYLVETSGHARWGWPPSRSELVRSQLHAGPCHQIKRRAVTEGLRGHLGA